LGLPKGNVMSEKEKITVTTLQKEIMLAHLSDMNSRATDIMEETSYLMANFKAMKIILDNSTEITVKNSGK
jgi:hypothetical protein